MLKWRYICWPLAVHIMTTGGTYIDHWRYIQWPLAVHIVTSGLYSISKIYTIEDVSVWTEAVKRNKTTNLSHRCVSFTCTQIIMIALLDASVDWLVNKHSPPPQVHNTAHLPGPNAHTSCGPCSCVAPLWPGRFPWQQLVDRTALLPRTQARCH